MPGRRVSRADHFTYPESVGDFYAETSLFQGFPDNRFSYLLSSLELPL